ncbi:MAG: hypothetical protein ACLQVA_11910 [Candidatus Brocadiia bacterium]
MNAEIICLYAFDIAQEADLPRIEALVTGTAEQVQLGHLKDAPPGFPMQRPIAIRDEAMSADGPRGPLTLFASVKLFAVGAMSIKVRVPVACEQIAELRAYREMLFTEGSALEQRVVGIARQVFDKVKPGLDTPVPELPPPERYTVFCIGVPFPAESGGDSDCEAWLREHEREVAALLVGEPEPSRLSRQEVHDTTKCWYSYYQRDLAVIDWDAALLIDAPEDYNDTLYVIEMANLQLEELRVYDQKLDDVLDKAYADVERAAPSYAFGERQRVLRELREIRMDMTKVSDEISNITKFFGEWHLARIYMGCAERFHLAEWDNMVSQKLRALDGLYTMLQQDSTSRALLILDAAIVGLFVIDLTVIILLGLR